jgi:GNAT superfamily N-acetyltransferase
MDDLHRVTDLLQRHRLADPTAGCWEAADLQWWSTRDPAPRTAFWPDTAVVLTRWSDSRFGCDVLGDPVHREAWAWVEEQCAGLAGVEVEMAVADDGLRAAAAAAGFTGSAGAHEVDWLDPADRAAPRDLPPGYGLVARPEQAGPHPLARRNGPDVEARLGRCSLYRPDLDLAVTAPDGTVAAYALFWADPRTGVGLVEPVRVEDVHAGQGLAGTLVRAGLDRLAGAGCTRLKVSHDVRNEAARRVYHGAGFRGLRTEETLVRRA